MLIRCQNQNLIYIADVSIFFPIVKLIEKFLVFSVIIFPNVVINLW